MHVVQEAEPLALLLQAPKTVALATRLWLLACRLKVMASIHLLPWKSLGPS